MNCDAALPLLYDLVDGDVGRDDAVALALHLGSCHACAAKLAEIRRAEELYVAKAPVPPPPDLARRITDAVRGRRPERAPEKRTLGIAAVVAAACAAIALAIERGVPGTLSSTASRLAANAAQFLEALRLEDSAAGLAAAWSQVTEWLAAPAVLRGSVAVVAALLVLQVGGSTILLARPRREDRR